MRTTFVLPAALSLAISAVALPAPAPVEHVKRSVVTGHLSSVLGSISSAVAAKDYTEIGSALAFATPTATQTEVAEAFSTLSSISAASPTNIWAYDAALVANGLVSGNVETLLTGLLDSFSGENSDANTNLRNPSATIFPQKSSTDAPYSLTAAELRAAIYIPPGFTYGSKPPVILFPGTGATGYYTFIGNFIPLLQGSSFADPVWVNVPGFLLGDAQVNAEYAAYAINYIAGITNTNVTMVAWSQGNIDAQWAYKYWPSTRSVVSDHIAISPDYDGTIEADFICPTGLPCDPAVFQQRYKTSSNFITQLAKNDGDSAYVPTTVLYSGFFDEIVEPQQGTGASAYLNDARGVGVSNTEVQLICPGLPAGSFYTHEGMLANPLSFALFRDAMEHDGPGEVSRIDTATLCTQYLATGLNLADFLLTEESLLIAGLSLVLYEPKVTVEPAIMSYATY